MSTDKKEKNAAAQAESTEEIKDETKTDVKAEEIKSDDAPKTAADEKKHDKKSAKKEKKTEEKKEAEAAEKVLDTAMAALNDKYLRLCAEYDNFRKRSKAEREGVYADACADVIGALLPVYDNIERAAAYTDADAEKLAEGIRLTVKSFDEALKKLGVTEIEAKTFDPSLHNAVMHVEDETKGDGEIVEVFQKGYKKGDKVIRYAMVKSAN